MSGESEEVRRHREENMHGEVDDQIVVSGWSITVAELKRALADVPDDYEVMLTCADVSDIDISDARIDGIYPPALGSVGIFRLGGGQIVNSEYAYHERMDAHHSAGGDLYWTTQENPDGEWRRH